MSLDLSKTETIQELEKKFQSQDGWRKKWLPGYVDVLSKVRNATVEELASEEFQELLWEGHQITGSGMCSVPMKDAIKSDELRAWIASLRDRELPDSGDERVAELTKIHDELAERAGKFTKRNAWLKILRLLAAIYPKDFTCIADYGKIRRLSKAMFDKTPAGRSSLVKINANVYQHLSDALGPPEDTPHGLATRSIFAWELYRILAEEGQEEDGEIEGDRPGESKLKILSNDRKKKGITSLSGFVGTCLKILDFVENGATADETRDFYKQENPDVGDRTVTAQLNTIRNTLGLLRLQNGVLQPSQLGQKLLDTEDPKVLIPRVVTQILGFDLILYLLREESPRSRSEMLSELRALYPKWTTDTTAYAILSWAHQLEMIAVDENKNYSLTEAGQDWAEQIVERPKPFDVSEDVADPTDPDLDPVVVTKEDFTPATLEEILTCFDDSPYVFPREIIAQLHVALHMHESKHFVLLSGLSGTGKTKLAELYANAYHKKFGEKQNAFYHCVVVQPDWTDPTGLLGYVNPLQETVTYASTPFLRFLISAVANPKIPHFVCLDEMNLARVEYYFAPFLSAMESERPIVIHQSDEPVDTIEPKLPWPKNLYIIGTVNMDETTHAFSDKVLDRAFTIEFWDVDLAEFKQRYLKANEDYPADILDYAVDALTELQEILQPVRQHAGYRTAEEVLAFLGTNHKGGANVMKKEAAMDQAIMMKTLPKIRGQDSADFRNCLGKLHDFLQKQSLSASARKVKQMKEELETTGTTRFWN